MTEEPPVLSENFMVVGGGGIKPLMKYKEANIRRWGTSEALKKRLFHKPGPQALGVPAFMEQWGQHECEIRTGLDDFFQL